MWCVMSILDMFESKKLTFDQFFVVSSKWEKKCFNEQLEYFYSTCLPGSVTVPVLGTHCTLR